LDAEFGRFEVFARLTAMLTSGWDELALEGCD